MLQPEITRVCKEDLPEILELQRLAFYENSLRYGNDPNMPPLQQTLEELIEESEGQIFLKATINGKIVGTSRGRLDGKICRISKLMVRPEHQNQGIGHKLMMAVENEFNAQIFELRTGHLDEKNISLYEKLGYVLTGEREQITDTLWFVRMRKEIGGS
jgi:ribosomal protein S18 acetylase RimI-like enzyme